LKLLKLYEKKFHSQKKSELIVNSNIKEFNSNLMKTELPTINNNKNKLKNKEKKII